MTYMKMYIYILYIYKQLNRSSALYNLCQLLLLSDLDNLIYEHLIFFSSIVLKVNIAKPRIKLIVFFFNHYLFNWEMLSVK